VPDDDLLRRLADLLRQSRRVESDLVAHIAEVDERRLYAREASSSMFAYCTEVLHLSEAEACLRITVARASREHPVLLDMLADGRLHLTGIARLTPHLTPKNRAALLGRATHRSRRQIEELIAEIAPLPDAPAVMRRLPEGRGQRAPAMAIALTARHPRGSVGEAVLDVPQLGPDRVEGQLPAIRTEGVVPSPAAVDARTHNQLPAGVPAAATHHANAAGHSASTVGPAPTAVQASSPALIQPLGAARYKVQFTAGAELRDKLERLRALMRSQVPDGDLAAIIERAVTEKLERLEARRFAKTSRPRKSLGESSTARSSRHIPAAVRRAVRERDGDRCRYVDASGRRCSERDRLEYHHQHPFGFGGDHDPKAIRLMCRAHNLYLAEHDYGRDVMARHRRSARLIAATALNPSPRHAVAPSGASP
jgi:hypothetical protein